MTLPLQMVRGSAVVAKRVVTHCNLFARPTSSTTHHVRLHLQK